jgi:hypothetical protein
MRPLSDGVHLRRASGRKCRSDTMLLKTRHVRHVFRARVHVDGVQGTFAANTSSGEKVSDSGGSGRTMSNCHVNVTAALVSARGKTKTGVVHCDITSINMEHLAGRGSPVHCRRKGILRLRGPARNTVNRDDGGQRRMKLSADRIQAPQAWVTIADVKVERRGSNGSRGDSRGSLSRR